MRKAVVCLCLGVSVTVLPGSADMLNVTALPPGALGPPAGYATAVAWFTLPEPNLQAGQKITGFNMKVGLTSSTLGMNNPPVNPALLGRLVPANPFLMPPPDCTKKGAPCIAIPDTLDGVDPNQKNKAVVGEFNFDQNSASVKLGANTNVAGDPNNKKAPLAGTTQRTDSVNLPWDARGNVDFVQTKIKGQNVNALTFGSGLYYQRASWTGPNLFNNGQVQRSIPSNLSFLNCFWTLNDDSTASCPKAPLTLAMGQDDFLDRNGNLLAGLVYSYTNDGSMDVDLSNLFFGTSGTQLALQDLGTSGTALLNPEVLLNGIPIAAQSDYDVPAGSTIQFLFPDTTDPNYIMQGDVSIDGFPQLEFAYEDEVSSAPEPRSWLFVGIVAGVMTRIATRRRGASKTIPAAQCSKAACSWCDSSGLAVGTARAQQLQGGRARV
jgi:hypothetical protein